MAGKVGPSIGGFALEARATDTASRILGPVFTNPLLYTISLLWRPSEAVSGGSVSKVLTIGDNTTTSVEVAFNWSHTNAAFQQAWYHRTTAGGFPVAKYTTTLQIGACYHCVGVYDGTVIRAYLDGRMETSSGAAAVPHSTAAARFGFGAGFIFNALGALGNGAEMAFWRTPLSARQVRQLYVSRDVSSIAPEALVDWWRVYQGGAISLRGSTLTETALDFVPARGAAPVRSAKTRPWRLSTTVVAPGTPQAGSGRLIGFQRNRLVRI
jgi:hypothetical protein